jgi:hypothetical protein
VILAHPPVHGEIAFAAIAAPWDVRLFQARGGAMVLRRIGVVVSAVLLVGAGMAIAGVAGANQRGPATTHTLTLGGLDFHSRDYRSFPQLLPDSGGGVYRLEAYGAHTDYVSFEAGVDLPAGASVTSVQYVYKDCSHASGYGRFYFGSYALGVGFTYHVPEAPLTVTDCTRATVRRTLDPPLVLSAARRYVVGVRDALWYGQVRTDPLFLIYGARVRYTCPNGC